MFVPVLYVMQAIPATLVREVTTLVYKDLGLPNARIALWVSLLGLPWMLKMFWSPVVDLNFTRRRWVLAAQALIVAALAGLALDQGLLPVVLGGPAERELGARVAGPHGLNRCGDTLQEAAAWMAGSVGAIGNDSGLGHLAAACGTPTLVLAGPMEPVMFRPFGPRVDLMAEPGLPCAPCGRKTCNVPGHPCLMNIGPEAAWGRFAALLSTPGSSSPR